MWTLFASPFLKNISGKIMSIVRMSIGASGQNKSSPEMSAQISYSARYFDDFVSYLVAGVGLAHAIESVHGHVSKYRIGDTISFSCKQSPAIWYWQPAPLLEDVSTNLYPTSLSFQRFDAAPIPPDDRLELGATGALLQTFSQALVTNYYERSKKTIEQRYGKDVTDWPAVWNFARTVRNAMAHGGKISILNPNAPKVEWKGLMYAFEDNGRSILIEDLWPGDLFDLIQDMDQFLHSSLS